MTTVSRLGLLCVVADEFRLIALRLDYVRQLAVRAGRGCEVLLEQTVDTALRDVFTAIDECERRSKHNGDPRESMGGGTEQCF